MEDTRLERLKELAFRYSAFDFENFYQFIRMKREEISKVDIQEWIFYVQRNTKSRTTSTKKEENND